MSMTLNEIIEANRANGWHWFDADWLDFFGDTIGGFSAIEISGVQYVCRLNRKPKQPEGVPLGLYVFEPDTGDVRPIRDDEPVPDDLRRFAEPVTGEPEKHMGLDDLIKSDNTFPMFSRL